MAGKCELWHLPWPLVDVAWTAFDLGFAAAPGRVELEGAEDEAARWRERALNPGRALSDVRQRRMDIAVEQALAAGDPLTEADQLRLMVQAAAPIRRRRTVA